MAFFCPILSNFDKLNCKFRTLLPFHVQKLMSWKCSSQLPFDMYKCNKRFLSCVRKCNLFLQPSIFKHQFVTIFENYLMGNRIQCWMQDLQSKNMRFLSLNIREKDTNIPKSRSVGFQKCPWNLQNRTVSCMNLIISRNYEVKGKCILKIKFYCSYTGPSGGDKNSDIATKVHKEARQ